MDHTVQNCDIKLENSTATVSLSISEKYTIKEEGVVVFEAVEHMLPSSDFVGVKEENEMIFNALPLSENIFVKKECTSTVNENTGTVENVLLRAMEPSHKCMLCHKMFFIEAHLKSHFRLHSDNPNHCTECEEMFTTRCLLRNHQCIAKTKTVSECPCKPLSLESMELMFIIEQEKGCYMCVKCNKYCCSYPCQLLHMKQHKSTQLKCLYCDKVCNSRTMRSHIQIHKNTSHTQQCPFCNLLFNSKTNLQDHLKSHKVLKCQVCDVRFAYRKSLLAHMNIHIEPKPYKCSFCKKTFKKETSFLRHLKSHGGEKPFYCSVCKQFFRCSHHHKKPNEKDPSNKAEN